MAKSNYYFYSNGSLNIFLYSMDFNHFNVYEVESATNTWHTTTEHSVLLKIFFITKYNGFVFVLFSEIECFLINLL